MMRVFFAGVTLAARARAAVVVDIALSPSYLWFIFSIIAVLQLQRPVIRGSGISNPATQLRATQDWFAVWRQLSRQGVSFPV
jgi:hypothetical protein